MNIKLEIRQGIITRVIDLNNYKDSMNIIKANCKIRFLHNTVNFDSIRFSNNGENIGEIRMYVSNLKKFKKIFDENKELYNSSVCVKNR